MKPMLAHRWADHKASFPFPCHVQPKLNGVRGIYSSGVFQSRDEILWSAPVLAHLLKELRAACPRQFILDGELYLHGLSLQQINGAVAVKRHEPITQTLKIEYHVFDAIDSNHLDLPFSTREELLADLQYRLFASGCEKIKLVPTTLSPTLGLAETLYPLYRFEGYEGLMYRNSSSPYGFLENCGNKQNRWKYLLKRKDWIDDEFEIISLVPTTGDKGFRGFQLTCITENGAMFDVGSGLSVSELDQWLNQNPEGLQARVRYECLSDAGIPLKPTLEAILE